MSDKPTYRHGTPERGVVYAWEGEVAGLHAKIDAAIRILSDDHLPLQSRVNDARAILAQ